MTKKKIISINFYNADKIELYFSNSNAEIVRSFAYKIIDESNKYLLVKYGKVDKDLTIENQLRYLEMLLNRGIITSLPLANASDTTPHIRDSHSPEKYTAVLLP